MKTTGQLLQTTRLERHISLEEIESSTKIRVRYLQALEADEMLVFPSYPVARGFLKNYAEFLGLPSKPILAVFRRDFIRASQEKVVPTSKVESLEKKRINWSPKLGLMLSVGVFLIFLMGYLGYQYFSLIKPPSLKLFAPEPEEKITAEKVEVIGQSNPDSLVTINGLPAFVSTQGEFRYQLDLFPGENKIVVEAKSKKGKANRVERTVFRLDK